jgi:hypothetical protein
MWVEKQAKVGYGKGRRKGITFTNESPAFKDELFHVIRE